MTEPTIDKLIHYAGIGDFIVEESHQDKIWKSVLCANNLVYPEINEICQALKIECNIVSPSKRFWNRNQIRLHTRKSLHDYEDGHIIGFFRKIREGEKQYRGSRLLELPLPRPIDEDYSVIVPGSRNNTIARQLNAEEYQWILGHTTGKLVILYNGADIFPIPETDRIIDMRNKCSFMQSVSYILHAKGFYGAASCLAVLASQMSYPCLQKATEQHFWDNKDIYAAPNGPNVACVREFRYGGPLAIATKGWGYTMLRTTSYTG